MKKIEDFDQMKAEGSEEVSFESLPVGPQIVKILAVHDLEDKEYLKIEFDIADGEFKGFFAEQKERFNNDKWPNQGTVIRSYKNTAYQFFTAFIIAIEKSNPKFKWNWDETKLKNKKFVANFGEEEYLGESNELKISLKCREIRSLAALREGKIKELSLKKLSVKAKESARPAGDKQQSTPKIDIAEDDLPF